MMQDLHVWKIIYEYKNGEHFYTGKDKVMAGSYSLAVTKLKEKTSREISMIYLIKRGLNLSTILNLGDYVKEPDSE